MMNGYLRHAVVAWTVLTLGGCGAVKQAVRMREPEFSLQSVGLAGLGSDSVDLVMGIDIHNPNPVPVSLEAVEYDLFLQGQRFLSGRRDRSQAIRALGDSRLELPLRLDLSDLRRTYHEIQDQDSTTYELRARLTFQIPVLGFRALGIKRSGRIPLVWPPRLQVASMGVERLSLASAQLRLQLRLINPNAFAVDLRRLDYQLTVSDHVWAGGASVRPVHVEPRGEQRLDLPVSVDLSELGLGVYRALLERRPLSYRFTGTVDLGTGLSLLPAARVPVDLRGQVDLHR